MGTIVDPKVEIEFTSSVWTDVTNDVDLTAGIAIQYGRTSEFSTTQPATCTFQLDNRLGKYTSRTQFLADGVTPHPYWPNILPRKRVRVSYTPEQPNLFIPSLGTDGSFESYAPTSPALFNGAFWNIDNTVSFQGKQSYKLFWSDQIAGFYFAIAALTTPVSSSPLGFHATAWVKSNVGASPVTLVASDTGHIILGTGTTAPADGAWHQLSIDFTSSPVGLFDIGLQTVSATHNISPTPPGGQTYTTWTDSIEVRQTGSLPVYRRYQGYINSWPPLLENGTRPYVGITATSRDAQFAKGPVQAAPMQIMTVDNPSTLWTMADGVNASASYDVVGNVPATPFVPPNTTATAAFGTSPLDAANVPWYEGVTFLATSLGGYWQASVPIQPPVRTAGVYGWTIEFAAGIQAGAATPNWQLVFSYAPYQTFPAVPSGAMVISRLGTGLGNNAFLYTLDGENVDRGLAPPPDDGAMHHYVIVAKDNGSNFTIQVYIDGVFQIQEFITPGDPSFNPVASNGQQLFLNVTASGAPAATTQVNAWGPMAIYPYPLSAARIQLHAYMNTGSAQNPFTGATEAARTGQLLGEYMNWAGVPAAERTSVDAGAETVQIHPTAGKTVSTLIEDMVTTEGGGSAGYYLPNGQARFCDRHFRMPGAPIMTLDATKDLCDSPWAPAFDDLTLITQSTVTQNGGSALTYTDTPNALAYGVTIDANPTSYCDTPQAALNLAQQRVTSQSTPGLRLPQVAFDLITSEQAGLAALWPTVEIGSRVRMSNLPAGLKSGNTLDVLIEGWQEQITKYQYLVTLDTSPADSPYRGAWDSMRWGPGVNDITLTFNASATITSLTVTNAVGTPGFTTVSASYPLPIMVGEEQMTITAAPSAPNPTTHQQNLTVTRGTGSTKAAAQLAGSVISLSPKYTWTL